MSVGKRIAGVILFFLIGIGMFLGVQEVLTPDWSEWENLPYTFSGFSLLEAQTLDAVFIGASQTKYSVYPLQIYSDTGILSYNLGTSGQPIGCSYYMLKYALQTQTPKVVVLDISGLFNTEKNYPGDRLNSFWRYIIDNLPLGKLKLEMAEDYSKLRYSDGFESAIFR